MKKSTIRKNLPLDFLIFFFFKIRSKCYSKRHKCWCKMMEFYFHPLQQFLISIIFSISNLCSLRLWTYVCRKILSGFFSYHNVVLLPISPVFINKCRQNCVNNNIHHVQHSEFMYIHKDKIGYMSGANASDLPNALNMKKKQCNKKWSQPAGFFWTFNNASR